MKLTVLNAGGKSTQTEVDASVFGAKPNMSLLSQAVHAYRSSQRQGTSRVKTRSEINRTKKKWYKQKHTGNARHGARTPSIFVGGGVAHGPTGMRNWTRELTKQQKKKAMVYALSAKAKDSAVVPGLTALKGKTKEAFALLNNTVPETREHVLIVLHEPLAEIIRAMQNIERALVTQADRINVHELLLADKVLFTEQAVRMLEKKFSEGTKQKKTEKTAVEEKKEVKKKIVQPAKKPEKKKATVKKPAVKKAAVKKTVKSAKKKAK